MNGMTGIGILLLDASISAVFAACVWFIASLTDACLRIRWQVTGIAFVAMFVVLLFTLSMCKVSGDADETVEKLERELWT